MKKISLLLAALLTLSIALCGCSGTNKAVDRSELAYDTTLEGPQMPTEKSDGIQSSGYEENAAGDIYRNDNNKIIRTASLTIQTTQFDAAIEALNRLTEANGGYYETADVESGGYYNKRANRSACFVVRIPRENFNAFRDGTDGIGHVYSLSERTQDVGESYYDTEARLETLTTKRDRLLALLEQAVDMKDIIILEDALAEVQYQIDQHTADLRKYDSLIGYSTFTIRLNEVVEITQEPDAKESFGSRLLTSLKTGCAEFGEGLQDLAIWFARNLLGILIFAAVVVVIVIGARRSVRRRMAKRSSGEEN